MAAKHSASPTSYRAFFHGLGHQERFPPTRLSAGAGFRKETIAGMRRNGRDAPKADLPVASGQGGSKGE